MKSIDCPAATGWDHFFGVLGGVYGTIAMIIAVVIALNLSRYGMGLFGLLVPATTLLANVSPRLPAFPVLVALLFVIAFDLSAPWLPVTDRSMGITQAWICVPMICLIISVARQRTLTVPRFPSAHQSWLRQIVRRFSRRTKHDSQFRLSHDHVDPMESWSMPLLAAASLAVASLWLFGLNTSEQTANSFALLPQGSELLTYLFKCSV